MSECQLQSLDGSVTKLSLSQRMSRSIRRRVFVLGEKARGRRARRASHTDPRPGKDDSASRQSASGRRAFPPLDLRPGEKVRVKSHDEILETLNADGKFQGLSYTPAMRKYCGGTYTVLKRVNLVFDERRWKLSNIRHVVLLEEVYCDGAGGPGKDWDGCDRTCFIWWKEGWLERASQP